MQEVPAAHTGFLNRARGVPIQELYKLAKKLKKRLVLTGVSLVLLQCMAMALPLQACMCPGEWCNKCVAEPSCLSVPRAICPTS